MKNIILLLIFTFSWTIVLSQEQLQFTQFVNNASIINPAFTGVENNINLVTGFRRQWTAIESAPMSYYAGFSGTLSALQSKFSDKKTLRLSIPRFYNKLQNEVGAYDHGVGMFLSGDHLGPFHQYNANLNYAFIYNYSAQYRVAFGISTHFNFQRFAPDNVSLYSPGLDQVYQNYVGSDQNQMEASVNVGVSLIGSNLFFGYALQQALHFIKNDFNADVDPEMVHFLTGGVNIRWNQQYTFQPAINVGYRNENFYSLNVAGRIKYRELLWGGLGYRLHESLAIMAGLMITQGVSFGYSYDFPFHELGNYAGGNHEMILRLSFYSDKISRNILW